MVDITIMTMEEYNMQMHYNNGPDLARPEIPATTNFKFKGHILNMLKGIPFFKKDHEDAYKHIGEVVKITDYLNIMNVTKDVLTV